MAESDLYGQLDSMLKMQAITKDQTLADAKLLVITKARYAIMGPFLNLWLKFRAILRTVGRLTGLSTAQNQAQNQQIGIQAQLMGKVNSAFTFLRNHMMITAGLVLAAVAAFAFLYQEMTGITDLDFGPITAVLGVAFDYISSSVMNFVSAAGTMFSDLSAKLGELMAYLDDTGALDNLILAVSAIGAAFFMVIGAVFLALNELGINWGSIFGLITTVVGGFVDFLMNSGLLAFFINLVSAIAIVLSVVAMVVAGAVVLLADFLSYFTGPLWSIITGTIGLIVDAITLAFAIITAPGIIFFAFLTGGFDGAWTAVKTITNGIKNTVDSWIGNIVSIFQGGFKLLTASLQWIVDKFEYLTSIDLSDLAESLPGGEMIGGAMDFLGFSGGGIASGPKSGYNVRLHGTEAVIPLPDGKTIPVSMQGGGGGENVTFNINVSGAGGDPQKIAKAVSTEVQRAFRTRARSGGYGRGI